jgi:predicted amino acid-binding ACT domain protein
VAFNRDEAKITVAGVPDRPGIAYAILGPIGEANIDVDMIIQNAGVAGMTDFSFTVHRNEYQKALDVLNRQVKDHIKATEIRLKLPVNRGPALGGLYASSFAWSYSHFQNWPGGSFRGIAPPLGLRSPVCGQIGHPGAKCRQRPAWISGGVGRLK